MTTPNGGIMRSSPRQNLSPAQRDSVDRLAQRVRGLQGDLEQIVNEAQGLVVDSVGGPTTRDEAFHLARAARAAQEADAGSRSAEFNLHLARAGAPMPRSNPHRPHAAARANLPSVVADQMKGIRSLIGTANADLGAASHKLYRLIDQPNALNDHEQYALRRAATAAAEARDKTTVVPEWLAAAEKKARNNGSVRPNYSEQEHLALQAAMQKLVEARDHQWDLGNAIKASIEGFATQLAIADHHHALRHRAQYEHERGAQERAKADEQFARERAKRLRPNVSDDEGVEISDILRGWLDAERLENESRERLIALLPAEYEPDAYRTNPSGRKGKPVARSLKNNPAKHAAQLLDSEFASATPHEREAVRRTLRVLAETGARDNPSGVTALALALPNPAGPHAVPPYGSEQMASSMKNPARVLAGKMAWASKSPTERATAIARLQGAPRDNISRPRWEILQSLGMAVPGPAEQFGGIPPFLTEKQARQYADAQAWRLVPTKAPKMRAKKPAKELSAEEKAKRTERAAKREENLTKTMAKLEKTLAKGGLSGDPLKTALAALKQAKEQEIAAYKQGIRMGQSSSIYSRSPGAYPSDASIQGYLARVTDLLEEKKKKAKSKAKGGLGLGLISAKAKKTDPAAWAAAQAKYAAAGKTDEAKATYQAELQDIAARKNPGGINGFAGWAKTVGYGLGGFVGGSALSGLINRVTNDAMPTVTRFAVPLAAGAAVWHFGKSWSPELRYGLIGGLVASALFKDLLLGMLSKLPLVGGLFASMAGGAPASAPAGTGGMGNLYDEAFGVNGYVLGDDDDDALEGYVLGDDDDDGDALEGYVLGDDDDDGDALEGYVLGDDDDDDGDADFGTGAYVLSGDVNDGPYDGDNDWSNGTGGFEEAVAGGFEEAVAGGFEEAVAGGFEEAVAGDDSGSDVLDDLEEAEQEEGMGDAQVKREVHPAGWAYLARKMGRPVAYLKANYKVLTMTPQSARNIVQAGRGKVVGRSKRYRGMILVLFRMTKQRRPRGPIERGAQVVRPITARRPADLAIRRPMGGAIEPGGIFQRSIFGTTPQYTQQSR